MKLEHRFTVPAPVPEVWAALLDPEKVAPCMPGATLTGVEGRKFTGTVKVRLGPVSLLYQGTGEFTSVAEDVHAAVLKASGKDTRGNGTASATVSVALSGVDGGTAVSVVTDLTVTGRPAQLGRGLISEVGGKVVDEFAVCLATSLGTGEAEEVTSPEPSARPRLRAVPDEPIDLVETAGVPVLKRVLPFAIALAALVFLIRRRRHR
ncbi:carbon monoxide dehydrogenase subunit G [Saccharothrix tamanrassetensis]|uniref:Carbon monoxide dehydrogenase subunit G n=1 Tax=Saccharothrix tamanrassetensis TaxID=1051531 RepID=A0A841CGX2_9PSEU|nr:SRPBCC family protein [Saccharothrix tamanrassetensis]MBB5956559.1 carbon monoxide dehydrogenase subunit G [Saccharothrix tamanrassetensis]